MSNKYRFVLLIPLICGLQIGHLNAGEENENLKLLPTRNYGYTLGDEIKLSVLINTSLFSRLENNQLPQPGYLNNWLYLKSVTVNDDVDAADYQVTFIYQLFKSVKENQHLTIPAVPIKFDQGGSYQEKTVPAFSFAYHPVIAATSDDQLTVQAALAAPLLDNNHDSKLLYALMLMGVVLIYIIWFYGKVPFFERYSGQFGKACKTLAKLTKQPLDENGYRQGLKTFHQAINAVHGGTLFQHQLPEFFTENNVFQPLQEQTEALFEVSQQLFFNEVSFNKNIFLLTDIKKLCQQYRKLERGNKWI